MFLCYFMLDRKVYILYLMYLMVYCKDGYFGLICLCIIKMNKMCWNFYVRLYWWLSFLIRINVKWERRLEEEWEYNYKIF